MHCVPGCPARPDRTEGGLEVQEAPGQHRGDHSNLLSYHHIILSKVVRAWSDEYEQSQYYLVVRVWFEANTNTRHLVFHSPGAQQLWGEIQS